MRRKQLTENSQEQKIISDKYSANFVIVLCYELLNYYEVLHSNL